MRKATLLLALLQGTAWWAGTGVDGAVGDDKFPDGSPKHIEFDPTKEVPMLDDLKVILPPESATQPWRTTTKKPISGFGPGAIYPEWEDDYDYYDDHSEAETQPPPPTTTSGRWGSGLIDPMMNVVTLDDLFPKPGSVEEMPETPALEVAKEDRKRSRHRRAKGGTLVQAEELEAVPLSEEAHKEATLVAFDVRSKRALTQAIDLESPGECRDPESDYAGPIHVYAAVVKKSATVHHEVFNCELRATRTTTFCYGALSTSFGAPVRTENKRLQLLGREACEEVFKKKLLHFEGKYFKLWDMANGDYHLDAYFSHGNILRDQGTCYPTYFSRGEGGELSYGVEETVLHLKARRIGALYDVDQETIDMGDLRTAFSVGKVLDVASGEYYWETSDDMAGKVCPLTLSQIYAGRATLYRPRAGNELADLNVTLASELGSKVVVDNANSSQAMALALGATVRYCETNHCHVATNLPGFAVCFRPPREDELGRYDFSEEQRHQLGLDRPLKLKEMDLVVRPAKDEEEYRRALAWSRTDFLHIMQARDIETTMTGLVRRQCELERKTLYNKLQAIAGTRNEYALNDVFGKGHTYVRVGPTVAYVTQGVPVKVRVADYDNCTLEVPVQRLESDVVEWMDPLTRILKPRPTEITCSTLLPVRWKLDGTWYCARPRLVLCPAPNKLLPQASMYQPTFNPFAAIEKGQLMTQAQMDQRDRFWIQLSSREAVVNDLVRLMVDRNPAGGRTNTLLSAEEFSALTRSVRQGVLSLLTPIGFLDFFGEWAIRFYAIITFIMIVFTILSTLSSGVATFLQYGWDGGRTPLKCVMAMCGCIMIPKQMWQFAWERNRETWEEMWNHFHHLRASKEEHEDRSGRKKPSNRKVEMSREEEDAEEMQPLRGAVPPKDGQQPPPSGQAPAYREAVTQPPRAAASAPTGVPGSGIDQPPVSAHATLGQNPVPGYFKFNQP